MSCLASKAGHPRDRAVVVGVARHDRDDLQVGLVPQSRGNDVGYRARPQVLVLYVDQAAGARERFPVSVCDAPLGMWCEWVAAEASRVGAQYLDRVRSAPRWVIGAGSGSGLLVIAPMW